MPRKKRTKGKNARVGAPTTKKQRLEIENIMTEEQKV